MMKGHENSEPVVGNMLILDLEDTIPHSCSNAVLALGNFDGVHRGHQAVLSLAKEIAANSSRPVGTIFLSPHPRIFFRPHENFFCLTPNEVKLDLLASYGLDFVINMLFNDDFAALRAEEFAENILLKRLGVSHVVVGSDFHFGRNRQGTTALMKMIAGQFNIAVTVAQPIVEGGLVCSSSAIRDHLRAGDVTAASRILGYDWFVRGTIVRGDQRGRTLGFPTANMIPMRGMALAYGIYAARMYRMCGGQYVEHDGIVNFGVRPTFGGEHLLLETHLFNFSEDLYDDVVDVALIDFIRPELCFPDVAHLIEQMKDDCIIARRILACRSSKMPLMTISSFDGT